MLTTFPLEPVPTDFEKALTDSVSPVTPTPSLMTEANLRPLLKKPDILELMQRGSEVLVMFGKNIYREVVSLKAEVELGSDSNPGVQGS